MLKKLSILIAGMILALVLCTGVQAAAAPESDTFRDFAYSASDGYSTVLTDLAGREYTYAGVLQPASLEQHSAVAELAAYAIFHGAEEILSVQLHDIVPENGAKQNSGVSGTALTNGYYSVELTISGGYTAFLTGLTPEYLETLEETALDAIASNARLRLEDLSFIDTEKQYTVKDENNITIDTDREMCWAASTANILHYTGWAKRAGFASADYMFEELIEQFGDEGGHCAFALQWFFNGYYVPQEDSRYVGWPKDESGYDAFRGYQPDYCYETLVREYDLSTAPETMEDVLRGLKDGCGAEISFSWVYNWERMGGHSTSLWGLVYRKDSDLSEKENWKAIIISDSDNDVTHGSNRRTAPNSLTLYQISPTCEAGYNSWYRNDRHASLGSGIIYDGFLDGVTLLAPYSTAVQKDSGTGNILTAPDLSISAIQTEEMTDYVNVTEYFPCDHQIGAAIIIQNLSKTACSSDVSYHISLTAQGGSTVLWSRDGSIQANELADDYGVSPLYDISPADDAEYEAAREYWAELSEGSFTLVPGMYQITATITSGEAEAYLSNNTMTKTIYVSERASSQENFSFSASAAFDGPPDRNYYGLGSIGHLDFSDVSLPTFAVSRYSVIVKYYFDDLYLSYDTIYCGTTFPQKVYGLQPKGNRLKISVYALPEDPTQGYECFAGTDVSFLPYFYIEMTASEQTFTPISEGDTGLNPSDEIRLSFKKAAANKNDSSFYLEIYADNNKICEQWIPVSEFPIGTNSLNRNIRGFRTYNSTKKKWESVSLPAGNYDLSARVSYSLDASNRYMYRDVVSLGTLTVFADAYGALETEEPIVTDTTAKIGYTFETPSDDFTVRVDYRTDNLQGWSSTHKTAWDSGIADGSITLKQLEPNTEYTYTVSVYDGNDMDAAPVLTWEDGSFTTDAAAPDTPQPPAAAPVCTLLHPDGTSPTMTCGEKIRYEAYLPTENGTWSFTFSGPDGTVQVWDETEEAWGAPVYFTLDGTTLSVPVTKDKPVRLQVLAYVAGEYTAEYTPTAFAYGYDEDGLYWSLSDADTQRCFLAVSAENGQLLELQELSEDGMRDLSSAPQAEMLRIFRMDRGTLAPIGTAAELSLAAVRAQTA